MDIARLPTVVIVRVVVAVLAPGVSDGELNVQLASSGRPLQEKLMGLVKEPCGVTVKEYVAVWPSVIVWLAGFAASIKLAAFTVCVNGADVLVRLSASPL